jgi:hypothetical protein
MVSTPVSSAIVLPPSVEKRMPLDVGATRTKPSS